MFRLLALLKSYCSARVGMPNTRHSYRVRDGNNILMGLLYPRQDPHVVLGPTTLTASFTDNISVGVPLEKYAEDTVYIEYTPAVNGSSIQIKFEGTPVNEGNYPVPPTPTTNPVFVTMPYFQETTSTVTAGLITHTAAVHTFVGATAGTKHTIYFYLPPAHIYGRFSMKETSAGAFGDASVTLLKSGG